MVVKDDNLFSGKILIDNIINYLNEVYNPEVLELKDNTDKHKGHAKNTNLHLVLKIKSKLLDKQNLLESHRHIYNTLDKNYMNKIHAISINIL